MHFRLCSWQAAYLAAVCLLVPGSLPAADNSSDVQQRILAVENGLVSTVRIKGRKNPAMLTDRMRHFHVPGVSVAVINHYTVEWAKAYGLADAEATTAATTDTLFQAASISKVFTAAAALQLVEQGVLDLDRNVNAQLKSWKVPENEFTSQHAVDLRGLLSHTAGLTVHGFPGYTVDATLPTVLQILDGLKPANTGAVRVNKVPGQGFRYAGGGTTIVQQLLIDVTDRPFALLLRESVLAPLGMSASSFDQPLPAERQAIAASGHYLTGKRIQKKWHVYPEMAAAGLWTTPSDIARYVIEIQLAHEGKSNKLLSQNMVEQMLTPQGGGPIGLGPFITNENGQTRFAHSGGNAGFSCLFVGLLDRGQGAVIMTNADGASRLIDELMNAIAATYHWPGYLKPERKPAKIDKKVLMRYVGEYDLGEIGTATITERDDKLFARVARRNEIELFFESETAFFADDPNLTGRFVVDDQGQVTQVVFVRGGQELTAKKKSS